MEQLASENSSHTSRSDDRPPSTKGGTGWEYRHTVLAIAMLAQLGQQSSRLAISPMVPNIMEGFAVTESTIGLALTSMWAAYALCQFPSGLLADRFGDRQVIVVAMALMGVGSLLLAAAPTFLSFLAAAMLLGAGTGLYYSVAASLLTKLFGKTGTALGVHSAAGSVAGFVAPVVAAAVGMRYGWRAALLFGAAFAMPVIFLFLWHVRPVDDSELDLTAPSLDIDELRRAVYNRRVAYTTVLASTGVFCWQAVASFYPLFLIEFHELSAGTASVTFGTVFLLSAAGQPVAGRLSDVVGRDVVIGGGFALAAVAFGAVLASSGSAAVLAATAAMGAGMTWFPVLQARLMDGFSDADRGSSFGLVRTVYMFVGATGSVVTGALVDIAGWTVAIGLLGGLLLMAAVSILINRIGRLGL